jgi:hypothetical protein
MLRHTIGVYAREKPPFFKPDGQVEQRLFLSRLHITETILHELAPLLSQRIGAELLPTYSYPVVYLPGAELKRHTDRPACEVTCTLTLINEPGDIWPIYIEENPAAVHRLELKPGDVAIYDGINYPHWREPQPEGHFNVSVFLHYVVAGGPFAHAHETDLRQIPHLRELYEAQPLANTLSTSLPHTAPKS